jgi:threonylcarbamoyladenosine tRNA methylthiotransferase MtaB
VVLELGVDLVTRNRDKDSIVVILEREGLLRPAPAPHREIACPAPAPGQHCRTRAFLKVQDGCDNQCAYCIVTIARGPARSRPESEVISDIRRLRERGFVEVILTGVHLGSYGHDFGDRDGLRRLIARILAATDVPRLRLTSLEPWDLGPELFELFADRRLLPHLHIPLQSGSDSTLRRMGRHTDQESFARLVAQARARLPDLSVSTDVMVGFPGETEAEFEASHVFVAEMAFSRLHVFRFSAREGTAAAGFPNQVPGPVAQERSRRMLELGGRLEETFNRGFVGRRLSALWERLQVVDQEPVWNGLTDNYIRVYAHGSSEADLGNRVTSVDILETVSGGVTGRVVQGAGS